MCAFVFYFCMLLMQNLVLVAFLAFLPDSLSLYFLPFSLLLFTLFLVWWFAVKLVPRAWLVCDRLALFLSHFKRSHTQTNVHYTQSGLILSIYEQAASFLLLRFNLVFFITIPLHRHFCWGNCCAVGNS